MKEKVGICATACASAIAWESHYCVASCHQSQGYLAFTFGTYLIKKASLAVSYGDRDH